MADDFVAVLSPERFGTTQLVIGNTLIEHRSLSYLPASQWTVRLWFRRLLHPRTYHHRCLCGWHSPGECIEYHQADMVIAAIRKYC